MSPDPSVALPGMCAAMLIGSMFGWNARSADPALRDVAWRPRSY